ncbi:hypothetical protein [Arthrobacter cheniae]|uniref:hypothetical protein n=1 Tax=Arthrobacter cheniae TaxID=1258888 RepID=UPI0015FF86EA|nr:hypothetical protein [Arthrobacter cheniae]
MRIKEQAREQNGDLLRALARQVEDEINGPRLIDDQDNESAEPPDEDPAAQQ